MNGDFLITAFSKIRSRIGARDCQDDDSEDALQDAFCRLWSRRDSIVGERQAEGLLATTSRNILIDYFRKKSSHPSVGIEDVSEPAVREDDGRNVEEVYHIVEKLVAVSLSERDREILLLRDRDGWSFEELSERFGLSEGNLRMIVSRCRKTIREIYRKRKEDL